MIAKQGALKAGELFMQKPLSPMNLAGKIRDVLNNNNSMEYKVCLAWKKSQR